MLLDIQDINYTERAINLNSFLVQQVGDISHKKQALAGSKVTAGAPTIDAKALYEAAKHAFE